MKPWSRLPALLPSRPSSMYCVAWLHRSRSCGLDSCSRRGSSNRRLSSPFRRRMELDRRRVAGGGGDKTCSLCIPWKLPATGLAGRLSGRKLA
jgi:hypothetical protein